SGGIYVREPLRLRQFPVTEVTRVATRPLPALLVRNTDGLTNQRAAAETTATALRLTRVASGSAVSVDLAYASYPTLAALAAQVTATAGGWAAAPLGNFANWPSSDLKPLQGAATAFYGGCALEIYTESVPPFPARPDDDGLASPGWRL